MAYDERLAERIRAVLQRRKGVTEKQMFGGVAFMLADKMFVGIVKDDLMVRVGPERNAAALKQPHARQMDFTGKPMNGYIFVAAGGCNTASSLKRWIDWGADFVATLPAKKPVAKKKAKRSSRTRA
jgi:TfoX/Sxy family transcriptional regulator of competence genes